MGTVQHISSFFSSKQTLGRNQGEQHFFFFFLTHDRVHSDNGSTSRRANTLVQEDVPDPTTLLTGEALSLLFTQNGRAAERKELRVRE